MNRITPRIVRRRARIIAQIEYGPVPSMIGIGPTKIMAPPPNVLGAPERMDVIIMKIIPIKIRREPNRNSLNGVDHMRASNGVGGASGLSRR